MTTALAAGIGEQVCSLTTPAGMVLHLLPKKGFRTVHAMLAVGYGSLDRRFAQPGSGYAEVPDGVAHFLEHRLFSSPRGDVGDRFAALGAEVNAHTTYTSTAFFFSGADCLGECLDLLLDFVFSLELSPEGIAREREIIARELQLYGDNLEWISFIEALHALYGDHPLGVDIAGTPASIAAIDAGVLQRCYSAFYRPRNMVLVAAGDFDVDWLASRVCRNLEGHPSSAPPQLAREAWGYRGPGRSVVYLPVALPRLCVGFADLGPPLRGEALLRRELCAELVFDILFGAASDFYARHYETGLIDGESFGCELYVEPEFSFALVCGDTPDPQRLEDEVVKTLETATHSDLLEKGFARAARRAYGLAVQRLDQVEGAVGAIYSAVSRGAEPFGLFEAHHQLSPGELRVFLREHLLPARRGSALVLPGRLGERDGK